MQRASIPPWGLKTPELHQLVFAASNLSRRSMSLAASAKSMSFSVARTDLDAWLAKILMAKSTAGGSRAQWHSRAGCYSPAFPSAAPCPPGPRQNKEYQGAAAYCGE